MLRCGLSRLLRAALLGFASGVMIAASVWSLLIPAIELSGGWRAAAVGFLFGMGFLMVLDTAIPYLHPDRSLTASGGIGRGAMLALAVTLHNLPEGMAVGAVFAGVLSGSDSVGIAGALALSAGIALQNVPEGAVISLPLVGEGMSRRRAFVFGALSGVVEPIGAAAMRALFACLSPVLPYLLAFAAGAMLYVVVEELIPEAEAGELGSVGTVGAALGFVLMMVLDVALG